MPFDWNDYLRLARRLIAAQDADDAALRSAVSRAYYCVFNLAMYRARLASYRPKDDASSHDQLWSLYQRNVESDACKEVYLFGSRLKRRRVNADYRTVYTSVRAEAEGAVEDAEACIKLLSELSQEFPKDVPRQYSF